MIAIILWGFASIGLFIGCIIWSNGLLVADTTTEVIKYVILLVSGSLGLVISIDTTKDLISEK